MGRFQQKFKQQIAFIKTNNFGPAVTVKNTPVTCFNLFSSFFSIFWGVSCKKLNFGWKWKSFFKIDFFKMRISTSSLQCIEYLFHHPGKDKYSAVICTYLFRRDNSRRSIRPPWDTKLCTADSMFPTGHSNLPHPHYLQVPWLDLQASLSSLLSLIIILICCCFLDGSQGGRSGGFEK